MQDRQAHENAGPIGREGFPLETAVIPAQQLQMKAQMSPTANVWELICGHIPPTIGLVCVQLSMRPSEVLSRRTCSPVYQNPSLLQRVKVPLKHPKCASYTMDP